MEVVWEIGWVGILLGLIVALYLGSAKIEILCTVVMLTGLVLFVNKDPVRMQPLDWSIILILILEGPSLWFSQYPANGVHTTDAIATAVAVFCIVRVTIRTTSQIAFLSAALALGGSWIGLSGMRQFSHNATILAESGFLNLVPLRSRLFFPPGPWIAGEWFTVLLLTLPFACAVPASLWHRQSRWVATLFAIPPVLIGATLILSLSRAVFWSAVFFLVAMFSLLVAARVITARIGGVLLAVSLLTLSLILLFESAAYPSVFRAYEGRQTSQVRSTEGRIAIWHRAIGLFLAHPLWGVGSSNAPLMLISKADPRETVGFASRTFSLPLQVLVEKGSLGLLIYSAFLALIARQFILATRTPCRPNGLNIRDPKHKTYGSSDHSNPGLRIRKAMMCCFAAGLLAVFCRELVYSSLLEHKLTLVLVAILSALIGA